MCADEEGDLLIESAVKKIPKVFVVSTLVSVAPAQPFIFRNYQVGALRSVAVLLLFLLLQRELFWLPYSNIKVFSHQVSCWNTRVIFCSF